MKHSLLLSLFLIGFPTTSALAQSKPVIPESALVNKTAKAIGYQVQGGATKIDLKGTEVMRRAGGEAKVEAKAVTTIEVSVVGLAMPGTLGTEFLTYVLWAVSPDGRTSNLGEILINSQGEGTLKATTQLQTFSLIVTAEPYYSVRQPSELVILENEIRKDTKGKIFSVEEYKLMKRSQYERLGNPLSLSLDLKSVPLEMYEARNAGEIAKSRGAEKYAPEIFSKADGSLRIAESLSQRKADRKDIISAARQTVQFFEDARALAADRQEQERIAAERDAAAARAKAEAEVRAAADAARAKAEADARAAEAKRRADEETLRQAEEARRQAELGAAKEAQLKAEAAARESALKAEATVKEAELRAAAAADAARAKAEADALQAKEEAARAETERVRQAAEALRAQLLEQFNRVLETRDTPRGLVVNIAGDVLFDTGKYDLRPATREKLARLSGILLANPGLNLQVEGHTDDVGSDESNQTLSQQRARSVREYLLSQGLGENSVSALGLGESQPIADNSTAAGRQKNRRVEIIVSGKVIGTAIGR